MAIIDPLTTELAEAFTAAGYHATALDPVSPSTTGIVDVFDQAGTTLVAKLHPDRRSGIWHSTSVSLGGTEFVVGFFPLREYDKVVWSISLTYPETAP